MFGKKGTAKENIWFRLVCKLLSLMQTYLERKPCMFWFLWFGQ